MKNKMTEGEQESIYMLLSLCKILIHNFEKGYDLNDRQKIDVLRKIVARVEREFGL